MPYGGDVVKSGAAAVMREYTMPVFQHRPAMKTRVRTGGTGPLPVVQSWLSVDKPEVALSAVKRPRQGAGIVIRVFNMSAQRISASLNVAGNIKSATRVRLDEKPIGRQPFAGNVIKLAMRPKEIITLLLR